jgi:hypothetical protein
MASDLPNGNNGSLPWWVRAVAYLGFPITVALFFLGQIAGWIPSQSSNTQRQQAQDMLTVQQQLLSLNKSEETADLAMREHRLRQEDLIRMLATGLRVICENGARSPQERNNCATIATSARYLSP